MADFITILGLSFAMFVGCVLFGWIPMAFNLSQRTVQLLTIFGAGLLVGTSLVVIIPEGVETMYGHHEHSPSTVISEPSRRAAIDAAIDPEVNVQDDPTDLKHPEAAHKDEHHSSEGSHQAVGISLLFGFVFMLLVDQIGGSAHHSHAPGVQSVNELKFENTDAKSKTQTATIGLVVHAAADGVALGAAASTDRQDLQLIVFLAIMLHKAPAAFGLSSFLMHEGLEPRKAKKHILAFALAAPLLAIITYLFLNQSDRQFLEEANATGIAMLFSAGTFLYVATVHVLPEITHSNERGGSGKLSLYELAILVSGSLFPLILNLGHHH